MPSKFLYVRADMDYKPGTMLRFLTYFGFVAPLVASFVVSLGGVFLFIYHLRGHPLGSIERIAYTFSYFVTYGSKIALTQAFMPALLSTALGLVVFITCRGLSRIQVLIVALIGALVGSALQFPFHWKGDDLFEILGLHGVFVMTVTMFALVAWIWRPKTWIGPLTKDELAVWSTTPTATQQKPEKENWTAFKRFLVFASVFSFLAFFSYGFSQRYIFLSVTYPEPLTVEIVGPANLVARSKGSPFGYPYAGCAVAIEWGDGTSSISEGFTAPPYCAKKLRHRYEKEGHYKIKVRTYDQGPADGPIYPRHGSLVVEVR